MAIIEFIIGPQNYFEGNYFDGDYTLSNVSKSYLQCDIDTIKGGRVVTGEYFLDNYIDGTYWHNNSIKAELVAEGIIVQEAVISMQQYYQEGYYSQGYYQERGSIFTLTASLDRYGQVVEFDAELVSEATSDAQVGKIIDIQLAMDSLFTPSLIVEITKSVFVMMESYAYFDISGERNRSVDITLDNLINISAQGVRQLQASSNPAVTTELTAQATKDFNFYQEIAATTTIAIINNRVLNNQIDCSSLFTPTLSVDVTKNTFAVLEAQSTLSVTGQVSVSRSISVSAQTSLTAQIKALKESAEADLINTFTLQVSAVKLKKTSAAIAAQATLTATPRETSRLVAALSSAFALSANPTEYATGSNQLISTTESLIHFNTSPIIDVRGAGTPVVSKRDNPGTTTTITNPTLVTGKFGNTINTIESGYSYRIAETTSINIVSDFTAEVWFNYQGDIPNYGAVDSNLLSVSPSQSITYTAWNGVVTTRDFSTSIWVYDKAYHDFAANSQPAYDWGLANGTIYLNWQPTRITAPPAGQITNVIIPVGWNHFLISRSGTYWYFFINGVLKKSWFGSPNGSTSTAISMGNGSIAGLYDEFRLRKDVAVTSNFALPTTEYFPPNPQYVHYSYGLWNTTATLTADYQRVKLFSSTMQSTASSSISANRYRGSGTTNMSVVLTQQTIGQKNAILASSISTTATESITYKRFRTTASQVTATTSQTTHATVVTVTNVAAQVTTEAVIINARTRACDAQITTTANLTCAAQTTARTQLALTAFNSQVAAAAKIGRGLIGLDIEVTMEVQAKVTTDTPIQVNSTSDLTAIASNVLFGDSQALVEANLTVTNDYLRRNESIQEVTTEVNALASRTRDNSSISTATTSLLAVTEDSKIPGVSAQLESTTAIVVDNQIVRLAQAELQAIALMPQVIPGVMVRCEADLIVEGFVLTAGQILHIDPYYQLKIEPEHRGLIITQEHRVITIEQETRVNKISGYKL